MRHAPTLALALLFAFGFTSCPLGQKAEDVAGDAGPSPHGTQFLVWKLDGTRSSTTWVREGDGALHTRTGIFLGGGGRLWKWATAQTTTPALDCGCYDPYDLPPREDLREAKRKACTRDVPLDALAVEEVTGDRVISALGEPPDDGGDPELFEGRVKRAYMPLGSVGKWLFVARREERMGCTDSNANVRWAFATIDLEAGVEAGLLSPSDTNQVENVEKTRAAQSLCAPPDCFKPDPAKVRFALMRPAWSPEKDLKLTLQYVTDAVLGSPDGLWDSGTRSTKLEAAELPEKLRAYEKTPAPVKQFWITGAPEAGGWTIADEGMRTSFGG
ncbi:MAG: hypothetical protein ACOZNI_23200 [Myxococcota bacterium]